MCFVDTLLVSVPFYSISWVDAWLPCTIRISSDEEGDLLFNHSHAGWKNVRLVPEGRPNVQFCRLSL